jgi:hypothetical protein
MTWASIALNDPKLKLLFFAPLRPGVFALISSLSEALHLKKKNRIGQDQLRWQDKQDLTFYPANPAGASPILTYPVLLLKSGTKNL